MGKFLSRIEKRDNQILLIFNETIHCRILDFIMPAATYLGSLTFCILFCVIAFLIPNTTIHNLTIKAAASLIISGIFVQIIKVSVNRIRPYLKLANLNIKKIGIDRYSFPSGHTTAAFSLAVMISLFFPEITLICISAACFVGISRMYLGVHFPTDVFVGIVLGTITSCIIYLI